MGFGWWEQQMSAGGAVFKNVLFAATGVVVAAGVVIVTLSVSGRRSVCLPVILWWHYYRTDGAFRSNTAMEIDAMLMHVRWCSLRHYHAPCMDENQSDADVVKWWLDPGFDRCIVACCDDAQRDQLRKIPKQSRWCHDVLEGDDIKIYGVNIAREVGECWNQISQYTKGILKYLKGYIGIYIIYIINRAMSCLCVLTSQRYDKRYPVCLSPQGLSHWEKIPGLSVTSPLKRYLVCLSPQKLWGAAPRPLLQEFRFRDVAAPGPPHLFAWV